MIAVGTRVKYAKDGRDVFGEVRTIGHSRLYARVSLDDGTEDIARVDDLLEVKDSRFKRAMKLLDNFLETTWELVP